MSETKAQMYIFVNDPASLYLIMYTDITEKGALSVYEPGRYQSWSSEVNKEANCFGKKWEQNWKTTTCTSSSSRNVDLSLAHELDYATKN